MAEAIAVIDRIEEGIAILEFEDRTLMELPARLLPEGAREGIAVRVSFTLDPEATDRFRRETEELQRRLREQSQAKQPPK